MVPKMGCVPIFGEGLRMGSRSYWIVLWAAAFLLTSSISAQQERWVYSYDRASGADEAFSIVAGTDSNLYVAGRSTGIGTSLDLTVISLAPSGQERWIYQSEEPLADWAESITTGPDSNLYVAGLSMGAATGFDFTVVSLSPSGDSLWVYRYNGPGNGRDEACSIVMGVDTNLYAAGASYGNGTGYDLIVVSLTPLGEERWVYRYDGPYSLGDRAWSIFAAKDCNLYVPGYSTDSLTQEDFIVVSLDTSGAERWVYEYEGPFDDWAYSIVMQADGNLYAAGRTETVEQPPDPFFDIIVVSLSPSGGERWVYTYDGPANSYDDATSIVAGLDGKLYVAGVSTGVDSEEDFVVISLDAAEDTNTNWVYRYNGPGNGADWARSIVGGRDLNLYAAGTSTGEETESDFTIISLSPSGENRWVYRHNGTGNGQDEANSIVMGIDRNLYAAGSSWGSDTGTDFTVVSVASSDWTEPPPTPPPYPSLRVSAYPVPAADGVTIRYSLQSITQITLCIYDLSGRLVTTLVDEAQWPGTKTLLWDCSRLTGERVSSGVYFLRLKTPEASASAKAVVLR